MRSLLRLGGIATWWRTIRGHGLYSHESQAIAILLSGADGRLQRFRLQWECATAFERVASKGGTVTVRLTDTYAAFGYMLNNSFLQSRPLTLTDRNFGYPLTYTISIGPGGRCGPLLIRTPSSKINGWKVGYSSQSIAEAFEHAPYIDLPDIADQSAARMRLAAKGINLHAGLANDDFIELRDPATDVEVDELCQGIGWEVPSDYLQFVACTNGMLIGETVVLPLKDAILLAKPYVSFLGHGIILAQDIINGLADGFWFMPAAGPNVGLVIHIDNYGKVDGECVSFQGFIDTLFLRMHEYVNGVWAKARKRLRKLDAPNNLICFSGIDGDGRLDND